MMSDTVPKPSTPRVLAIANQKGGVGKTTTAINLGAGLAEAQHPCLIIDLDPQGNASTGLNFFPENRSSTSYHALTGETTLASTIAPAPVDHLSISPASADLAGLDTELVDYERRAQRLLDILVTEAQTLSRYDYILIDCPPSLNLLTVNAMVAADAVVVPLQCEFFALEGLSQLLGTIRRIQTSLNPKLKVEGIVLTMFDSRNNISSQVADDVRANLGDVVYETVIPRNVRLSEAPSHALPVMVYDPDCAGSRAYRALSVELLQRAAGAKAA